MRGSCKRKREIVEGERLFNTTLAHCCSNAPTPGESASGELDAMVLWTNTADWWPLGLDSNRPKTMLCFSLEQSALRMVVHRWGNYGGKLEKNTQLPFPSPPGQHSFLSKKVHCAGWWLISSTWWINTKLAFKTKIALRLYWQQHKVKHYVFLFSYCLALMQHFIQLI